MSFASDPQAWRRQLTSKLEPERIRSTLAFAALFQMVHEMIKQTVIEDVKNFYGHSPMNGGIWLWGQPGEEMYKREVLALAPPKQVFQASLQWLQASEAITTVQVVRLKAIYEHRHELTHELTKFIVDVESEPDVDLLTDAVQILRDISRFWVQVEKDVGSFDEYGDVAVDDVLPGSLLVLNMCIHAYVEGLETWPAEANDSGTPESG